jgi:ribulose-5-phosphate 4-epimerase/fuculose-1-phosphate aldolase
MLLRNHGPLTVGASIAEAFLRLHTLETACSTQVRALAGGSAVTEVGADISTAVASQALGLWGPAAETAWPALLERVKEEHPDFAN